MKTITNYYEEIKEKYTTDLAKNTERSSLYKLTPGSVQNTFLHLIDQGLSKDDLKTMNIFFKSKEVESLRRNVKSYDIDGFRPICKFLGGKTESVKSHDLLEIIAILVDYESRPFMKFRTLSDKKITEEEVIVKLESSKKNNNTDDKIKVSNHNAKVNGEANLRINSNRRIIIIICSIIIVGLLIWIPTKQQRWMVWQEDHYKKVSFNLKEYDISQLKIYKAEWVKGFKQIIPGCGVTKFFKDDGSPNLWYGKSSVGNLEFFTHYGLHPETGKTLKPITDYMIGKHICK